MPSDDNGQLTDVELIERLDSLLGQVTDHRDDGVINALSGLGDIARDRNESTAPGGPGPRFDSTTLDNLYHHTRLVRRIVDRPAADATRAGFAVTVTDGEATEPFADEFRRLRLKTKLREAHRLAALTGGAGILVVLEDGLRLDQPVVPARVQRVKALHVVDRFDLIPMAWDDRLDSPTWDEPLSYSLTGRAVTEPVVDASRVIRFEGVPVRRDRKRDRYDGWGQPLPEAVWESLRDLLTVVQGIATASHEFVHDVLKLKDLKALLTGPGGEDDASGLKMRIQAMMLTRSLLRATVLDADSESLEQRVVEFKGAVEAFGVQQQLLSADTHQPLTLIFGQSPKGFTSEDTTGLENWRAHVEDEQERLHAPAIRRVTDLLMVSRRGPTSGQSVEYEVVFRPLDSPSSEQMAATRKTVAEADAIYMDRGVLSPDDVRRRHEAPEFQVELALEVEGPLEDFAAMGAIADALRQDDVRRADIFSGPGDEGLPDNVKALAGDRRSRWVAIFNRAFRQATGTDDEREAEAFRTANGAIFGRS